MKEEYDFTDAEQGKFYRPLEELDIPQDKNSCQKDRIMSELATTKMSSKGQVIIPEEIRKRLNLKSGAQFVVVADNDVVILKNITPPSMEEFDTLIAQARAAGKESGLKKKDIQEAIIKARRTVKQ